jgi:hypothetical protein
MSNGKGVRCANASFKIPAFAGIQSAWEFGREMRVKEEL